MVAYRHRGIVGGSHTVPAGNLRDESPLPPPPCMVQGTTPVGCEVKPQEAEAPCQMFLLRYSFIGTKL